MSNILALQQSILDMNERINREVQFGEDSLRELTATVGLMKETLGHLETQMTRLFNERNASLVAIIGHPAKPQTLTIITPEAIASATVVGTAEKPAEPAEAGE